MDELRTVDPPWYQPTPPLLQSPPAAAVLHHSSTARARSTAHRPTSIYLTTKLKRPQTPNSSPHRTMTIAMLLFTALRLFPRSRSMLYDTPSATALSPAALHYNRSTTYSPHRASHAIAGRDAQALQAQAHHHPNHVPVLPARVRGRCRQCNDNRTTTTSDPSQWVAAEPQQSPSKEPSTQSKKKPSRDDSDTEARSETTAQRSNPASDVSAMASRTYEKPPPGQNPIQHATDRLTAQLVNPPSPSLRVPGAPNLAGHDPPNANPDATTPTPGPDADQLAAAGLVAQRHLLEAVTHQANQAGQLAANYDRASRSATIRTAQMKRYIQAHQSAPLPDLMLEMVRICDQSGEDPGPANP
ncbi:hypothetical protein THAOC_22225 [Thalassiosira oceanica]|uniref:Uncharacterized protein n=1 Tax=Thalassiosira oceanica TaxID=159749 RepID=K0S9W5_THAOC|nr:hypothetical protein THAOC_22225 [Thalassiosira oceanica]|eukprot:EJK57701.1 hypothetical protein THAOC_22225 [Thalassiosira oceanica]